MARIKICDLKDNRILNKKNIPGIRGNKEALNYIECWPSYLKIPTIKSYRIINDK